MSFLLCRALFLHYRKRATANVLISTFFWCIRVCKLPWHDRFFFIMFSMINVEHEKYERAFPKLSVYVHFFITGNKTMAIFWFLHFFGGPESTNCLDSTCVMLCFLRPKLNIKSAKDSSQSCLFFSAGLYFITNSVMSYGQFSYSASISHHPQEFLLAQCILNVHKSGLKPDSFHSTFDKHVLDRLMFTLTQVISAVNVYLTFIKVISLVNV